MLQKYFLRSILLIFAFVSLSGCPKQNLRSFSNFYCGEKISYSGGLAGGSYSIELKQKRGIFAFNYDNYEVADQFDIFYEGRKITTTGCSPTNGMKSIPIQYSGSTTSILVKVAGNCKGRSDGKNTKWEFKIECPLPVCDFSTAKACDGASGIGCTGVFNAIYDHKNCMVRLPVTLGSIAHDKCCATNPNGYLCGGPNLYTITPNTNIMNMIDGIRRKSGLGVQLKVCELEFASAASDIIHHQNTRMCWYGPYFTTGNPPSRLPAVCE